MNFLYDFLCRNHGRYVRTWYDEATNYAESIDLYEEVLESIFESWFVEYSRRIKRLLDKNKLSAYPLVFGIGDTCYKVPIQTYEFVNCSFLVSNNKVIYCSSLFEEDCNAFNAFYSKATKDCNFLYSWLSKLIVDSASEEKKIAKYIPKIIRKNVEHYKQYCDLPYEIPEDYKSEWLKAENLIAYYYGLKLLL